MLAASATLFVVFLMMRLLAAATAVSLTLGATQSMPVPFDLTAVAVAAALLYQLVSGLAGTGAARVAAALLVASLVPTLPAATVPRDIPLAALATLSLPWWLPLLSGIALSVRHRSSRATMALTAWWALSAGVALAAPAPWAAMATSVETAAAAALAGVAVAALIEVSQTLAQRRGALVAMLAATCVWQAWLVLGMGRPERLLVPMLAAALMIAATDLLTEEPATPRDSLGPAMVIAMLVLGLVPGAHMRRSHHRAAATLEAPAGPLAGAESHSSIAAP